VKYQTKAAIPKDAATVILLNQDCTQVLWAQRNPELKFLGGWHAFPGGKLETSDAEINVENCADAELAKFIACAVRETFEEVGVLLVRGGEKLTKGQFVSLHDDLISGRFSLAEILASWGLRIDAKDFFYTGFWTTPQFSPVRFKTRFFLAVCPPKQKPYAAITELQNVEFIAPKKALDAWGKSEVLISPPVLISLKELFATENTEKDRENLTKDFNRDRQDGQDKSKKIKHSVSTVYSYPFSSSASLRLGGEKKSVSLTFISAKQFLRRVLQNVAEFCCECDIIDSARNGVKSHFDQYSAAGLERYFLVFGFWNVFD